MDIVERPIHPPGYCLATLAGQDSKGFIDTNNTPACVDPRVYISVTWVEQMGRELGMVDGELLEAAHRKIKELEAQMHEQDKMLEASEHVITHLKPKQKRQRVEH